MTYLDDLLKPKDRSFQSDNTGFIAVDSPIILNINNTLGTNAITGEIICDGPGDILIDWSINGNTYNGNLRLKQNEKFLLKGLSVHSIKLTWASNSAYRVFAS